MFMVYWMEGSAVCGQPFPSDQMSDALAFMEQLRAQQRTGEPLGFITMCSENPDSVGHPGVTDPAPDYNWKKRRR